VPNGGSTTITGAATVICGNVFALGGANRGTGLYMTTGGELNLNGQGATYILPGSGYERAGVEVGATLNLGNVANSPAVQYVNLIDGAIQPVVAASGGAKWVPFIPANNDSNAWRTYRVAEECGNEARLKSPIPDGKRQVRTGEYAPGTFNMAA
jgi:hypothetical protein